LALPEEINVNEYDEIILPHQEQITAYTGVLISP
jgi:hypothetical protein